MATNEPKGLGVDFWMKKFEQEAAAKRAALDPSKPMDVLQKMQWLHSIEQRHRLTTHRITVGKVDDKLAQELKGLAAEYEQLLQLDPPKFPIDDLASVQLKIAEVYDSIASSFEALQTPDYAQAAEYYKAAIEIYRSLAKNDQALRSQDKLDKLKFASDRNVGEEILRLRTKLDAQPIDSLDYVEVLVDLGMLYSKYGDDYEAEQLLKQAEEILHNKYPDPTGTDIGDALAQAMSSIMQGKQSGAVAAFESSIHTNGLYRVIYVGLARIYKTTNPQKAEEYLERAGQRDSRENNNAFSQRMLRALDDLKDL
jgi:tetratricopeptide (TPR) repeat protein